MRQGYGTKGVSPFWRSWGFLVGTVVLGGGTGGHLLGVFLVYERTRTRATYRQNRRFMVELR